MGQERQAKIRKALQGRSCWVLSDGKAGDTAPALGIAQRLGLVATRLDMPKTPENWQAKATSWAKMQLAPWRDVALPESIRAAHAASGWPDILIGSGRAAVALLPTLKRASAGRCFTVYLKHPGVFGGRIADFIWTPAHDSTYRYTDCRTLLTPHLFSPQALAQARDYAPYGLANLPTPRVAVLLGGNSKDATFTPADIEALTQALARIAAQGATLMVTSSRRTPPELAKPVQALVEAQGGFFWDSHSTGENPYPAVLTLAQHIIVTADSINMVSEALAAGVPVTLWAPATLARKHSRFMHALHARGWVEPMAQADSLNAYPAPTPRDDTDTVASALARAYLRHTLHYVTQLGPPA